MSTMWKLVSVVTLLAVIAVAAAVVLSKSPSVSAQGTTAGTALAGPTGGSGLAAGSTTSGITVAGDGKVQAKPDVAHVGLGVRTFAATARDAMNQNNTDSAALIAKLQQMGVDKKDIQTGSINLYPQTNPSPQTKEGANGPDQIVGYWANNSVNVTVRDFSKLGDILDGAITAGANSVNGVSFGIADDSKLRDQALQDAIKNARAKADLIAGGLGLKVTGVQSVSIDSYSVPSPYAVDTAMMGKGAAVAPSVPVEGGELTVMVTVRVTFNF